MVWFNMIQLGMGIFTRSESKSKGPSVLAEYAPQVLSNPFTSLQFYDVTRQSAMTVPSVVRARNLIAGTIAAMPLELYRKTSGQEIQKPLWLDQIALNQTKSVTIAYTVDSLLFYGVSYWRVTERYQEDNRPARFEWIANHRVTPQFSIDNNLITGYFIDAAFQDISDMVTFQSLNDGILASGSLVLQAAIDLEKSSKIAASTPMASGYIKNTGADLDPKEVRGLLDAWKTARNNRSTAYLTSTLEYTPASFSPKEMLYNEAKQDYATQIARLCNLDAYMLSADANNSMTYSNLLDARKQFVSLTLQPFISAIEERLSMNDITANNNLVHFNLESSFLRANPLDELAVIEKLLSLGLITLEQAMEMTDLTPNGKDGL